MKKYKILVTNDDGIDSFFLKTLVKHLNKDFDVYVAAPMGEQSWIGRAISRDKTIHMAHHHDSFGCKAWALDGTPSDCVNIALGHLMPAKPDVVVSGINITHNVSTPLIFSSGTVAGAIEGICWGIPAVSFSHFVAREDRPALRVNHGKVTGIMLESLENASSIAAKMTAEKIRQPHNDYVFSNVNFPMGTQLDSEIQETRPAPLSLGSIYQQETESSFAFCYPEEENYEAAPGTDLHCLLDGKISVSEIDLKELGGIRSNLTLSK